MSFNFVTPKISNKEDLIGKVLTGFPEEIRQLSYPYLSTSQREKRCALGANRKTRNGAGKPAVTTTRWWSAPASTPASSLLGTVLRKTRTADSLPRGAKKRHYIPRQNRKAHTNTQLVTQKTQNVTHEIRHKSERAPGLFHPPGNTALDSEPGCWFWKVKIKIWQLTVVFFGIVVSRWPYIFNLLKSQFWPHFRSTVPVRTPTGRFFVSRCVERFRWSKHRNKKKSNVANGVRPSWGKKRENSICSFWRLFCLDCRRDLLAGGNKNQNFSSAAWNWSEGQNFKL